MSNRGGNINPFRYRSYYFDVETGLYYLQSRYYDPQVGRFISMDQVEYLAPYVVNGLNLYAYCLNNPVIGSDPEGTGLITLIALGIITIGLLISLRSDSISKSSITSEDVTINGENPYGSISVTISEGNIHIKDSYKITDRIDQEKIIDIVMDYEIYKQYNFSRSKESYIIEWRAHNIAHNDPFGIVSGKAGQEGIERAGSVDLNEDWENDEFCNYYWLGAIL